MSLFERIVTLAVGQAGVPGFALTGLRVSFRIEMSQSSVANTAKIRIWNANPLTMSILDGPAPTVILSAGYGAKLDPTALIPRQIFAGSVVKNGLTVRKEGPDRIFEIEAQDGGLALQTARINLSFATPTALSLVVAAIQAQMGLPTGLVLVAPDIVLPNGGVFSGQARDVLDRIAATTNSSWWITDGLFYFTPNDVPVGIEVPVFSAVQGNLIGSPKKKDRGGVEVRALLDASLRPGGNFLVVRAPPPPPEPPPEPQLYIASDVIFEGDSGWAVPFYVTTVGRPVAT